VVSMVSFILVSLLRRRGYSLRLRDHSRCSGGRAKRD
jgi:hypothetical protein